MNVACCSLDWRFKGLTCEMCYKLSLYLFQRVKERKTYLDQDIDDDEIEGKRTYNLEERLASTKHNKSFVITDLRGEGMALY